MAIIRSPHCRSIALLGALLVFSAPGHAQLGASPDAAGAANGASGTSGPDAAPRAVMHRAQDGLTYRESTDAHGIVVREYVDAQSRVYAVTWRGPAMPDVRALLGAYFDRFRQGADVAGDAAGLHATRIADGDLVVENHVRLREFSGRAWLVSALPPGVQTSDIE